MQLNGRARLGVLAILAAATGTASALFVALARTELIPCGHHEHAAETLHREGLLVMSGMATATVGSGDVCPIFLNAALIAGALAAGLALWLLLTAAGPLVGAIAAALRLLVAPGGDVPWLAVASPIRVNARAAMRRRRPSRAPPAG